MFFLDEMGVGLNLSPLYGRAPLGQRVYDEQPVAKGKRVSLIAALSTSGIKTALNFEGTLNGDLFLYFLTHFLCPLLSEGDTVVLDNASPHKVSGVREIIEKTGANIVYLPPYHPDLNPIELAWNKMKQHLRKQRPRTSEALYNAYSEALKCITQRDAGRFIDHAMAFLTKRAL